MGTGTCVSTWPAACFYVLEGCWVSMQVACMTLDQMAEPVVLLLRSLVGTSHPGGNCLSFSFDRKQGLNWVRASPL